MINKGDGGFGVPVSFRLGKTTGHLERRVKLAVNQTV
jgi:hypothetical protein